MKLKTTVLTLAAAIFAATLGFVGMARADAVLFSGNTNLSSPTTIDTYLTYTSASFTNVSVPVGPGLTTLTNLGTFTLNGCSGNNCTEPFGTQDNVTDFTLRITFTDPTVSGTPQLFAADIYGTITRSGASNNLKNGSFLVINFDNTVQHLSFTDADGSGEFDLAVNDVASYTSSSSFGDTRTVTGRIQNLTYTPSNSQDPPAVPEPGSIVLLLSGLGGVAFSLRRKQLV